GVVLQLRGADAVPRQGVDGGDTRSCEGHEERDERHSHGRGRPESLEISHNTHPFWGSGSPSILRGPTDYARRSGLIFPRSYIRKTPKVVSGTGAFSAAEMPSASTRRVSSGSMIPSSHRRAVE